MPVANIAKSLQAGVLQELKDTWRQKMPTFEDQVKEMVRMMPYTNLRTSTYPFKEALPFPRPWGYTGKRAYQIFRDRQIQIYNFPYELTVPWSKFDEEDDQLSDMKQHVQSAVKRYGQLPHVLLSEYFNGTANYNPAIVTCYDGVSLFSATDGDGAQRFNATGGNILTGSQPTLAGVLHDLARAQQRWLAFRDPAGQPLFDAEDAAFDKMVVHVPTSYNEIMWKASKAENIRSDTGSITAETNTFKGTFTYKINSRLTDTTDYYIQLSHEYYKPFCYRSPKGVETVIADIQNSDRARESNEYALYSHIRTGLSPWIPFVFIKVNF